MSYVEQPLSRRAMLQASGGAALALASIDRACADKADRPMVRTVLGPVAPDKLGATLMHEHAPIVDWSELYETKPAPVAPVSASIPTVG